VAAFSPHLYSTPQTCELVRKGRGAVRCRIRGMRRKGDEKDVPLPHFSLFNHWLELQFSLAVNTDLTF